MYVQPAMVFLNKPSVVSYKKKEKGIMKHLISQVCGHLYSWKSIVSRLENIKYITYYTFFMCCYELTAVLYQEVK